MLDYERVKVLRERAGLTLEQAAVAAGLGNRQRWQDIESGRRQNVTLKTLGEIAGALGCAPCDLLADGKVKRKAKGGGK